MADETSGHETGQDDAEFARAAQEKRGSFISEFWQFARHNKKWWLTPIIVILLLVGLFVVLTGTGVGALIYPLF